MLEADPDAIGYYRAIARVKIWKESRACNMNQRRPNFDPPQRGARWLRLPLLALGLAALCQVPAAQSGESAPPLWQEVRPGLSYSVQEFPASTPDMTHRLHWLRIDLQQVDLEVTLSPQQCSGLRLTDLDHHARVLASINASFFSRDFLPRGHTVSNHLPWSGVYRLPESPLLSCSSERKCEVQHKPPEQAAPDWRNVAGGVHSLLTAGVARSQQDDARCGAFCLTPHPRTAIGLDASGRWLFWLAAEGRQKTITGLSLYHTAQLMQAAGVAEAINFDGGGSTDMHVLGQAKVARPDNEPLPRRIANAWLILLHSDSAAHGKIEPLCATGESTEPLRP